MRAVSGFGFRQVGGQALVLGGGVFLVIGMPGTIGHTETDHLSGGVPFIAMHAFGTKSGMTGIRVRSMC
jgi:hypothetical protein